MARPGRTPADALAAAISAAVDEHARRLDDVLRELLLDASARSTVLLLAHPDQEIAPSITLGREVRRSALVEPGRVIVVDPAVIAEAAATASAPDGVRSPS